MRIRNRRRRRSLGMTLLEIMIVLAILALVMGLLVGPKLFKAFSSSKVEIAKDMVNKLAHEAYPQWAIAPGNGAAGKCPSLAELAEFTNNKDLKDPWGNEYQFRCNNLPAGVNGIAVWSKGEDGADNTGDDLKSW